MAAINWLRIGAVAAGLGAAMATGSGIAVATPDTEGSTTGQDADSPRARRGPAAASVESQSSPLRR